MNALVSAIVSGVLTCAAPGSDALVGRWEPQSISRGGVGTVIDFRPDGSYVQALGVVVDLRYATLNDELTVSDTPGGPPAAATATRFRIDGDQLTIGNSDSPVVRATRIGLAVPGASPIVGAWRYRHPAGGMSYDRYTMDGRYLLRLPMSSQSACYAVNLVNHEITVMTQGSKTTMTFQVDGRDLQLNGSNGRSTYHRSEYGPWYDIDHIDYHDPETPK